MTAGRSGSVGGLGDGETGALTGADQGLGADLLLAPREVVVDRPERRIGLGDNLFDPGGRIPLATEQADGRVEDAVAGLAGVDGRGHEKRLARKYVECYTDYVERSIWKAGGPNGRWWHGGGMTVDLITGHETRTRTRRGRVQPDDFLGNFSVADHARIRAVARLRELLPGDCLFDQGSVATAAFLVTERPGRRDRAGPAGRRDHRRRHHRRRRRARPPALPLPDRGAARR